MDEKIKELKEIAIAYKAALNYDYCPDSSKAEEIIMDYFKYDLDSLKIILNKYEGWSTGDIESKAFCLINEL